MQVDAEFENYHGSKGDWNVYLGRPRYVSAAVLDTIESAERSIQRLVNMLGVLEPMSPPNIKELAEEVFKYPVGSGEEVDAYHKATDELAVNAEDISKCARNVEEILRWMDDKRMDTFSKAMEKVDRCRQSMTEWGEGSWMNDADYLNLVAETLNDTYEIIEGYEWSISIAQAAMHKISGEGAAPIGAYR
ncbi:hypothetical protein IFM12275_23710 [Nocardia sputorum]|uniref:hypothetical protein n=1 Tax=Nocardia sputorum TaxID=2984338 RepID=UPI00248FD00F|nr:hypothetical protein [Nocardia sputorum]BDT92395.1 hypothetical protein IFM12275_23710 [Nocardia sputorum]